MSLIATTPIRATAPLDTVLRATGWVGLGLIAIAVSLSDFLAGAPADAVNIGPLLAPPSDVFAFGTDLLGRDMLSETLHGLSATVRTALPAMLVALAAGALFGFVAARLPRALALSLRGTIGIPSAVPALLLAMRDHWTSRRAAGPAWRPDWRKLLMAPVRALRARGGAGAGERIRSMRARAAGISAMTLLRRDLVYEFTQTILSSAARALAAVTIILSTVSFLGFAAVPPHRDLGLMIAASKGMFLQAWWTAAFPALALTILILFARLAAGLGEGERA